jgi:hypothetical protein
VRRARRRPSRRHTKPPPTASRRPKRCRPSNERPAYYQEKTIGKPDPGGTAGLYIMKGFKEYFESAG